jgi:hypothetical protein
VVNNLLGERAWRDRYVGLERERGWNFELRAREGQERMKIFLVSCVRTRKKIFLATRPCSWFPFFQPRATPFDFGYLPT